jgi:hypothetical protein
MGSGCRATPVRVRRAIAMRDVQRGAPANQASRLVQRRSGSVDPGSELQDRGERAGQVIGRVVSCPLRAPADETVGPDQHGAVGLDSVKGLEAAGRRL